MKENNNLWLEKQGEQKTFDYENADVQQKDFAPKTEPKFHKGDLVVLSISDGEKVVQIDSVEYFKSGEPKYITSEGKWFGNGTKAHLWTIEDAKDGDVLLSKYNQPFIYNGIFDEDCVGAYCGIDKFGDDFLEDTSSCDWSCKEGVKPTTKEQRDLLFSKMKEAGYEWDDKKNELWKIEKQGEKEEVDGFDAELNALLKKYEHLSKEELQEPLEFYLGVVRDDLDVVREEKPKWTDEDEHHWMMCLECVEECATQEREDFSKTINWLKSIKQWRNNYD